MRLCPIFFWERSYVGLLGTCPCAPITSWVGSWQFRVPLLREFQVQKLKVELGTHIKENLGTQNSHHCPFVVLLFSQLKASWWNKLYALHQSKHLFYFKFFCLFFSINPRSVSMKVSPLNKYTKHLLTFI